MIRRAVLLLCLGALLACERAVVPIAKPVTKKAAPRAAAPKRPNLLDIARGAAVVSRTAENNLEISAVHAIDGLAETSWSSSPGAPNQTLVYSLAAPARIDRLGIETGTTPTTLPNQVRFELSSDGVTWQPALTLSVAKNTSGDIAPTVAQYVRIHTEKGWRYYATAIEFIANGTFTAPPPPRAFGGCWSLNFSPARVAQRGARITGEIQGKTPTVIDGGVEDEIARFMWRRGPMWGHGIATVSADGRAFSALTFFEEARTQQVGEAWMGERSNDCASGDARTPDALLERAGHWSMFGLVFDERDALDSARSRETLDAAAAVIARMTAKKFRIVAHEFRSNDANENMRRSEARATAVGKALIGRGVPAARIELAATGSMRADAQIDSGVQRLLWSRVDLELLP